ncbi:MAG: polysaccharide deacetylase family protein [Gaiellaceae bacterium]
MSRPLVLCYHAVSDGWPNALAVRPVAFERQLQSVLRRGFRPVDAAQAVAGRGRMLHVTFDDAYASISGALDVLERLGVQATVFAATGFAEEGRPLDVPELAAEAIDHPHELRTMNWDELRGVAERGFEVGSHTVGHPHLTRLADTVLDRELRESRARCEGELGRPCRYLAYPYGEHDRRVEAASERAGYEAAFTLHGKWAHAERYAVKRVDIYRADSPLRARLKTSFARSPAYALAALLRAAAPR